MVYCSACEDEDLDGNIACLVDQDVECVLGFGPKSNNWMELGALRDVAAGKTLDLGRLR